MATHNTLTDLFNGIADAIRDKKNSSEPIMADNFPTEISNLRTSFNYINSMVTRIEDGQFKDCEDLLSVECDNLTSIGSAAFDGCSNLKTVVLPDSVVSVGENAFKGCSESIVYCENNIQMDNWHTNWNPDNCLVIYGDAIESWDISASESDNVCAQLYTDMYNEGKYNLIISGNGKMLNWSTSSSASSSGPWYNYAKSIITVTIGDSVTSIGQCAFLDCTGLTSVTIPNSVTSIGNFAFRGCTSLSSVTIPNSVPYIGNATFYSCTSLTSVTIPDSVTIISGFAFYNCTSLTSVTIPNSVTRVDDCVFYNCTSLTSVTIPDSLTSIGEFMFYKCTGLTSVTIPDSVTSIGENAFYNCSRLTNISFSGTTAQWNSITKEINWNANTNNYTIYCTDGSISKSDTINYYTEGGAS